VRVTTDRRAPKTVPAQTMTDGMPCLGKAFRFPSQLVVTRGCLTKRGCVLMLSCSLSTLRWRVQSRGQRESYSSEKQAFLCIEAEASFKELFTIAYARVYYTTPFFMCESNLPHFG
jgi:hypothetical protein